MGTTQPNSQTHSAQPRPRLELFRPVPPWTGEADPLEPSASQVHDLLTELHRLGVDSDTLSQVAGQLGGRVTIGEGGLRLPDGHWGSLSVHLTPMETALYLFFLHHPEGMRKEDLTGYYDELCRLYNLQCRYSSLGRTRRAIQALCFDKGTFYANRSRIHGKVLRATGDEAVSDAYTIVRGPDGLFRIREAALVTIDDDLYLSLGSPM